MTTYSDTCDQRVASDRSTTDFTRVEWARRMADMGLTVFILEPGSKRPLGGHSWYTRNTKDPDLVSEWFDAEPDCNFAVHPGAHYVVIDLDRKPQVDGITAFEELCAENGMYDFREDLDTLIVKTANGGYHLYFKTNFPCANKHDMPAGIDVRGAVGYVVGPGCEVTPEYSWSTGTYEVLDPGADIAQLPDWLAEKMHEPGRKDPRREEPLVDWDQPESIEQAREWLKYEEPAIQGENGDDHTFRTICALRDFAVSEGEIFKLLNEGDEKSWNARCEPPWPDNELLTKIENSFEYASGRPGVKSLAYHKNRMMQARPPGGWGRYIRQDGNLALVVDNDDPEFRAWRGSLPVADHDMAPDDPPFEDDARRDDLFPAYLVGELDQIPDPVWLIQDVLPEMSLAMTYGETGSLKTFLELDKALWGAVGEPWAASKDQDIEGFKIMRPLRTVIVAGEGARGLKRRIAAWAKRHGIKTDDLPILVIPVMPRFADEGDLDKLIRTIKAKLPDPDYVIVDTAMWAASGLNLNIPADSQVLLSSFKRVMLYLGCSLTFVHHTGKDKKREQLGAENLIAGVDVADRIDLEEKGTGYRRIKITNKKMKDAELRETISMEAHPETVGTEEDGRKVGSLVLRRCQESAKVEAEHDPRLTLALGIIAENKGKMPLNMSELAEKMTRRSNSEDLSDGELEKAKEGMRSYLRKAATRELAVYAHKAGKARNAQWVFEDR